MAIEKNQNPGSRFGATSLMTLPIQPIYLKIGPNWPNRQCCLAGSSKTAPRILIISIAMSANNSFYVKSIATYAPTFFGYIILVLANDHFIVFLLKNKITVTWLLKTLKFQCRMWTLMPDSFFFLWNWSRVPIFPRETLKKNHM